MCMASQEIDIHYSVYIIYKTGTDWRKWPCQILKGFLVRETRQGLESLFFSVIALHFM